MKGVCMERVYKYPPFVRRVEQLETISAPRFPIVISILETDTDREMLDIRLFENSKPTVKGVFISYRTAEKLKAILDDLLNDDIPD